MRSSPTPPRWTMQLALFHPPLRDPRWDQLPWEVRQQTVRLLARILREHYDRGLSPEQTEEARDE
jgi:hypothetical protein